MEYRTINDKLHVAELMLDSVTQSIHKTPNLPPKSRRWLKQLHLALGLIRSIQKEYPQLNYTLTRCSNVDELPWEKQKWLKSTGRPRSMARIDWHTHKKRKRLERTQLKLPPFFSIELPAIRYTHELRLKPH
jgi:hypothetical protein